MPPRLDLTPYWLITPVAIVVVLVAVGIVVAVVVASRGRRDDER